MIYKFVNSIFVREREILNWSETREQHKRVIFTGQANNEKYLAYKNIKRDNESAVNSKYNLIGLLLYSN